MCHFFPSLGSALTQIRTCDEQFVLIVWLLSECSLLSIRTSKLNCQSFTGNTTEWSVWTPGECFFPIKPKMNSHTDQPLWVGTYDKSKTCNKSKTTRTIKINIKTQIRTLCNRHDFCFRFCVFWFMENRQSGKFWDVQKSYQPGHFSRKLPSNHKWSPWSMPYLAMTVQNLLHIIRIFLHEKVYMRLIFFYNDCSFRMILI